MIPLFQRQLQRGGPITVTHPEARRYFMTIPEAVRLVLQAGAMGRGGEVLLLDMGEQVRIVDLARQLIRMSGMREGQDIEIVYTGLRPGEKLYEELHSDTERARLTRHERIPAWDLDAGDEETLNAEVATLEALAREGDKEAVKRQLRRIVPEYIEPHHDALEPAPETPLVELPAAVVQRPVVPRVTWSEAARVVFEGVVALMLLALSAPLWMLLWLEARRAGEADMMVHEVRVGRTRRRFQRRVVGEVIPIDRRSIERRTQDLLGAPIRCARFRSRMGPLSRWAAARHLDKLPFLLNVVRGEMALVGPSPERGESVLRWKGLVPGFSRRFDVLPGVTGLAQISGRLGADGASMTSRTEYDLFYVENHSMLLDIRTLFRTASLVVRPLNGTVARRDGVPGSTPSSGGYPTGAPSTVKGVPR